jgi:acetyltransferase
MQLDAIFYPKSIAVIGASRTLNSVGNDLVKNLVKQGFTGKIYPVNPTADELYGLQVRHSVGEIPENFDLALIAVPAKFVPQVLRESATKGAKAAIIISAGFKEVGSAELEQEVAQICEENDIALIGPNCLGVINPEVHMNASFAKLMPDFGDIAFISQSGALCSSVLDYATEFNLGFSKFLSIGNKACIDEVELLKYFAKDPHTKVIAMYVEQLEDAQTFIKVAREVGQGKNPKPILILKSGRTSEGAAAIASHTGSLAGGDAAYQTLFAQSGVIRANTIRELFEFIDIFSHNPLKKVENVAIITNAGGPGVLTTDEVISSGLKLSKITDESKQKLHAFLPTTASVHNPVDILGDAKAERYKATLDVMCDDPTVDGMMVILTPQSTTEVEETAKVLVEFRHTCQKPIVASFMGKESTDNAVRLMEQGHVSTSSFPELGVRGLRAMGKFVEDQGTATFTPFAVTGVDAKAAQKVIDATVAAGHTHLPEAVALQALEAYHFPTLKRLELRSEQDIKDAAKTFTSEVALKIISPDIVHKSDVGGVMLGIKPEDIEKSYHILIARVHANVPTAKLEGVLAVEMAPKGGIELILGANKVPGLGTMVMVGLGGIYVEVFKDISFGYAPLSKEFSERMVETLRCFPVLQGTRGQAGYDIDALLDVIGRVSAFVTNHPEVKELDMNPVVIFPKGQGVKILDARILL